MLNQMRLVTAILLCFSGLSACAPTQTHTPAQIDPSAPYVLVLGIAQDAGAPQAGSFEHRGWTDASKSHLATSLGLVDPASGEYWIFDATPDFRRQWYLLQNEVDVEDAQLSGVFLTHAHIGHYVGLMFLGHESAGASDVPVFSMPKMSEYLRTNGPWSQLVNYENIEINELSNDVAIKLNERLSVTPFLVPHRQEFSETVGYMVEGPNRRIIFLPDIDSWSEFDEAGGSIESLISDSDIAFLDGSFFANGEIPGRDMSGFPHPFISTSMSRFESLPQAEKDKIRFIHLNHTNPALDPASPASVEIISSGFAVAKSLEKYGL